MGLQPVDYQVNINTDSVRKLAELLLGGNHESFSDIREKLRLDENSIVLCISTEGDTDKKITIIF